ncbi:hypothetical protein PR048_002344 [Dryococelus australis]|uniref:Uncharacterized protein n=1 Tax=Dryococelus australis TaxID=614101 RepID=A0ABQ9IJX7_9NEOP|nr:hypothetical protein PR048_002344 [Dryococelus australis]
MGKRETPDKTRRPVASPDIIPICENPEATPPRIEHCSPGWEAIVLAAATVDIRYTGANSEDLHSGKVGCSERWNIFSGIMKRSRSEGAIRATLACTPSASSLLRARRWRQRNTVPRTVVAARRVFDFFFFFRLGDRAAGRFGGVRETPSISRTRGTQAGRRGCDHPPLLRILGNLFAPSGPDTASSRARQRESGSPPSAAVMYGCRPPQLFHGNICSGQFVRLPADIYVTRTAITERDRVGPVFTGLECNPQGSSRRDRVCKYKVKNVENNTRADIISITKSIAESEETRVRKRTVTVLQPFQIRCITRPLPLRERLDLTPLSCENSISHPTSSYDLVGSYEEYGVRDFCRDRGRSAGASYGRCTTD